MTRVMVMVRIGHGHPCARPRARRTLRAMPEARTGCGGHHDPAAAVAKNSANTGAIDRSAEAPIVA